MFRRIFSSIAGKTENDIPLHISSTADDIIPSIPSTEEQMATTTHDAHAAQDKLCGHCLLSGHNKRNCPSLNAELDRHVEYCSTNKTNIESVREYLRSLDKTIVFRYAEVNRIDNYMYYNCSEYYDNVCINNGNRFYNYVEIIIGYLCILPMNPLIKHIRPSVKKQKKTVHVNEYRTQSSFVPSMGVFLGPNGINVGIKLL